MLCIDILGSGDVFTRLLLPIIDKDGFQLIEFVVSTRWLKRYLAIHLKRFDTFTHSYTGEQVHKVYNSAYARKKIIKEEVLL